MMIQLFVALIAASDGPPAPPGFTPPHGPSFSPKGYEMRSSLGAPMARVAIHALIVPEGFVITNISLNAGQVCVQWQNGQPLYQVLGSVAMDGWQTVGYLTAAHSSQFPIASNHFWRVQGALTNTFLTVARTNNTVLSWTVPEIDMADAFTPFIIQRRSDTPTPGNGFDYTDDTGWQDMAGNSNVVISPTPVDPNKGTPSAPYTAYDTSDPAGSPTGQYLYRLKEILQSGVRIPENYAGISTMGGVPKWVLPGGGNLFAQVRRVAINASVVGFAGSMENFVNWGDAIRNSNGGLDSMYGKASGIGAIIRSAAIGSIQSGEAAQGIVFDASGNMWIFGHFGGTVNFSMGGSSDISQHTLTSNGTGSSVNIYLAGYDTSNPPNLIALKAWGSAAGISANDLAIDSSGNFYLAVNANGSTTFDPGITVAAGSAIVKLNPSLGAVLMTPMGTDSLTALAVDTDNSFAVTGTRFNGQNNAFLTKFAANGSQAFDRTFNSPSAVSAGGYSLTIDPSSHRLIVVGLYGKGTDFGMTITDFFGNPNGNPGDPRNLSGGSFIACYDSSGTPIWARTPNVAGYDQGDEACSGITIDSLGRIFFSGKCNGAIYLGNTNGQILLGGHASYAGSVDINGAPRWGFRSGGASGWNQCVAVGSGMVLIGGRVSNGKMYFDNSNQLGGGSVTTTSGVTMPFLAAFSP